jgi:hypothetical protein
VTTITEPVATATMPAVREEAPPPEGSWPILEIGGCIGALIIHAGVDDVGNEIHLCPAEDPAQRSHNVVRERRGLGVTAYAAVFPSLPEGAYLVLPDAGATDGERVRITGAQVTETRWSPGPHVHEDGTTHSSTHHHNQRSHHHAC